MSAKNPYAFTFHEQDDGEGSYDNHYSSTVTTVLGPLLENLKGARASEETLTCLSALKVLSGQQGLPEASIMTENSVTEMAQHDPMWFAGISNNIETVADQSTHLKNSLVDSMPVDALQSAVVKDQYHQLLEAAETLSIKWLKASTDIHARTLSNRYGHEPHADNANILDLCTENINQVPKLVDTLDKCHSRTYDYPSSDDHPDL